MLSDILLTGQVLAELLLRLLVYCLVAVLAGIVGVGLSLVLTWLVYQGY